MIGGILLKMSVKLAVLKTGEQIISDAKELVSDDKVCGYLFENPHIVEIRRPLFLEDSEENTSSGNIEISLAPWIVLSSDTQIPVSPDVITTIVNPIDTLKKMYEEKVNGTSDQVSFVEE